MQHNRLSAAMQFITMQQVLHSIDNQNPYAHNLHSTITQSHSHCRTYAAQNCQNCSAAILIMHNILFATASFHHCAINSALYSQLSCNIFCFVHFCSYPHQVTYCDQYSQLIMQLIPIDTASQAYYTHNIFCSFQLASAIICNIFFLIQLRNFHYVTYSAQYSYTVHQCAIYSAQYSKLSSECSIFCSVPLCTSSLCNIFCSVQYAPPLCATYSVQYGQLILQHITHSTVTQLLTKQHFMLSTVRHLLIMQHILLIAAS